MPTETTPTAGFTVEDLARRWRVSPDKIRALIRKGELAAVNLAGTLAGRPQLRVMPEAVSEFEQRRSAGPPPKPPARRPRLKVHDFYPD